MIRYDDVRLGDDESIMASTSLGKVQRGKRDTVFFSSWGRW